VQICAPDAISSQSTPYWPSQVCQCMYWAYSANKHKAYQSMFRWPELFYLSINIIRLCRRKSMVTVLTIPQTLDLQHNIDYETVICRPFGRNCN
jgi:hypothetical protein